MRIWRSPERDGLFFCMTLQTAQDNIAILLRENTTPTVGSTDWNTRLKFINLAINDWASEEGMLWNELYTTLASAADGTKTTDGTASFATPANLDRILGFVELQKNGAYLAYDLLHPENAHIYAGDTTVNFCYLTGKPGSYTLNFLNAPDTGLPISYPYYKTETYMVNPSDVFEMTDANFCVYRTVENIALANADYFGYNTYGQKAQDSMVAMKTRNLMLGHFQDDSIPNYMDGFGY